MRLSRFPALALLMMPLILSGCGGSGDEGGSIERPFEPRRESAVWNFSQTTYNGQETQFSADWVGPKEIGGKTYQRLQAGSFRANPTTPEGTEVWIDWEPDQVTFGGGEVYFPISGVNLPGQPLISGTTDEPLVINLNPPLGVPQTIHIAGSAVVGDPANPNNPYTVDTDATYTLVEENVTVETSAGPIPGCKRFQGTASAYGMDFEGDAWYHPELGMVASHINWPEPEGTTLDLLGIDDYGPDNPTTGDIQKFGVITPGGPAFRLDTYDVNQALDADKDTHAKMLLEIRWLDEEKAKSDLIPAAYTEFGTVFGYFPHSLTASPLSILHPEDNGKGYTFWIALVDQAAKNEPTNGISYHISAQPQDYASSPMRVTARILYHKVVE